MSLYTVLLLALLPAAGSLIGVLLAEWKKPSPWLTGAALHAAAGIATAVAATELVPRAHERIETWLLALAILAGAGLSVLLARLVGAVRERLAGGSGRAATWGVYAAIGIDLLSDGLMTGGGGAIERDLGVLLAASQVLANIPGGFAATAGFRAADVGARSRRLAMVMYPLAPLLGALAGYLLLRGAGPQMTGFVLAIFAGLLLLATIEDMVPEADEPGTRRSISSPAFAGGFVLLLLLSAYLGA